MGGDFPLLQQQRHHRVRRGEEAGHGQVSLDDRQAVALPQGGVAQLAVRRQTLVGRVVDAGQAGSTASMAATTSPDSGSVRGRKRLATVPSGATRNFSKFHWMSPASPFASGVSVSKE